MTDYDSMAHEYRKLVENSATPVMMSELYTFRQRMGDVTGLSILDLGCGEGRYTRRLAQLHPGNIIGVDISREMVELAQRQEAQQPLGIEYAVTDAREMDSMGHFDLVTSFYTLNHARSGKELLQMCKSIAHNLRAGGRFFGFNNNVEMPPDFYPMIKKYGFRREAPSPLYEGAPIQVWYTDGQSECQFTDYYLSRPTYEWAFREAGFDEIVWHPPLVAPDDVANLGEEFWQDYLKHPTFIVLEGTKAMAQ